MYHWWNAHQEIIALSLQLCLCVIPVHLYGDSKLDSRFGKVHPSVPFYCGYVFRAQLLMAVAGLLIVITGGIEPCTILTNFFFLTSSRVWKSGVCITCARLYLFWKSQRSMSLLTTLPTTKRMVYFSVCYQINCIHSLKLIL